MREINIGKNMPEMTLRLRSDKNVYLELRQIIRKKQARVWMFVEFPKS